MIPLVIKKLNLVNIESIADLYETSQHLHKLNIEYAQKSYDGQLFKISNLCNGYIDTALENDA